MLNRPSKLPQTDSQSQTSTKVSLKSKHQHGIPEIRVPILVVVPVETLTGITSYLNPPALSALATVNKYLSEHVKDDNTWRRAFVQQFLGIGPECDLGDERTLLLRRTERSWRNEFIVHYTLIRRWERSRNVTTAHVPVHSTISGMRLMPSHALLTSSIEYGIVARSLPLTGKILPGYLDASGTRAGLGIGNPNAEFTPDLSACAMTSDGGTAKVVWGSRIGHVTFTAAPRAMETNRRSAADVRRCNVVDEHEGAVLDAQWLGNWVITGGADGRIKLWDAKTVSCPWTSERITHSFISDPCVKVCGSTLQGWIVAVIKSGDIHFWRGFDFASPISAFNDIEETTIKCPIRTSTEGYDHEADHGVISLHVDPTHSSPTILVAYLNDAHFYRIEIDTTTGHIETTAFGDPYFGSTSIVVPFFRSDVEVQNQQSQSSFVLVGDHIGCISLYAWDANPSSCNSNTQSIHPVRKFEAHQDGSSVTALAWNSLVLITGSARGTTHVWDALTFTHLRSFASPVPRLRRRAVVHPGVNPADRECVKHILVSHEKDVLFVGVGDRVMCWRAGAVPNSNSGGVRGRHSGGALVKKKGAHAKYLAQVELHQNIIESRDLLTEEAARSQRAFGREKEHRAELDNLGLSEIEAVEYVLMLSRDEANSHANAKAPSGSQLDIDEGVFEGDFEDASTEGGADDDALDSTTSRVSSNSGNRSPSPSSISGQPTTSSSSSSSASSICGRSGMRISSTGRHIPRVVPSSSNEKVQVSPPYREEPMEAGPDDSSASGSASASGSLAGTRMHLEDHYFPPISASTSPTNRNRNQDSPEAKARNLAAASPLKTAGGSPKSLKSSTLAWSIPLKKSSISDMSSSASSVPRSNAWAGPSRISPPTARQQAQRASLDQGIPSASRIVVEEMDDDLRFAMELSRAEARSRGEDV